MDQYTLKREEAVLFIVDIQERLAPVIDKKDQVIANTGILIRAAEEMGIPLLATEQYPKGLGRTVEDLLPLIGEDKIISKMSFTAYTEDVKKVLESLGRKKIILAGMETHVCVFQTSRDLLADGYQVYLVGDAVSSRTRANYQNGLDLIQAMGGVITNTETVIFDLLKVSGTPEFKAMSRLIK